MVADNKELPSQGPARPAAAAPQAGGDGAASLPSAAPQPPFSLPATPAWRLQSQLSGSRAARSPLGSSLAQHCLLRAGSSWRAQHRWGGGPGRGEQCPRLRPRGQPSPKPPALGVITTWESSLGIPRLVSLAPLHPPCLSRSRPRALSGTAEGGSQGFT